MGLIGTALGAIGNIFGGIAASKAMNNVKNNLKDQQAKNLDWFNRRYNEDPTQRASAQALFTRLNQDIRDRNKAAAAMQAVAGGTEESVAAAKAANNDALAKVASNIAVNGEARKDAIESQYQQTDANLQAQLNNMEIGKANAISQAMSGLTQAAGDMDFGELKLKNGNTLGL